MPISIDEKKLCFQLDSPHSTYLLGVTPSGSLVHLHYGGKISDADPSLFLQPAPRPYAAAVAESGAECPDELPFEYGCWGKGDFRSPAIELVLDNGDRTLDLRYAGYCRHKGILGLEGQPNLYVHEESQADTLEILLRDEVGAIEVSLFYTVFRDLDAIVRRAVVRNLGSGNVRVERLMSLCLPLPQAELDLIHLHGAWARERHVERMPLGHHTQSFGSTRGASGHIHNPFAAVVGRSCTERHGKAYGASLIYSGSFLMEAETDSYGNVRFQAGIHPQGFSWLLKPQGEFATPPCVLVFSGKGLGEMSRTFHRLYREHLCPPKWKTAKRPVVVNNYEATYFDFNGQKLIDLAKEAAGLQMDLLVMDDGWFAGRNGETTSLGDWVADEAKLGCSLEELAQRVKQCGVEFGMWIEPEMVSEDSMLYRSHPDWCLQTERKITPARYQYVLDFSRDDVVQHIGDAIADVLRSADISYVKWDMNRNITDAYSALLPPEQSGEVLHRYICNVYKLAHRLTSEFPHILFEGCAGGGGRFDPAQLYYMPHIWTSDDMDPIERMKIQYGTSLVYPPSSMAAHVCSAVNHTTGRVTPLDTRGHCAMMGGEFGYEVDITTFTEEEKATVRRQIAEYKDIQHLVLTGDFYRLADPFSGNCAAWMFVDPSRSEFVLTYIQALSEPNGSSRRIYPEGLEPGKIYREHNSGVCYHGDTLMETGLAMPVMQGDFLSVMYRFSAL